ncbi:MAG: hypothetical protein ACF8TS_23300, partial [Maioricimonas sp. JB049]
MLKRFIGSEWKVLLVVAVGLAAGELGMRAIETRLSIDVDHLKSFRTIAQALREEADPDEARVLFLGNSLTRLGVDQQVFEQFAEADGWKIHTAKMNPDNTALAEWYYAYGNFFADPERAPDVLIVGFEGGHLRDHPSRHPARLAHYYCDANDWQDLRQFDLFGFEDAAGFWLARWSAMYSNRDRIERRLLDELIPGYRDGMQIVNERQTADAEAAALQSRPTYRRLREFIAMARAHDVRVILAAMPIAERYELDPELLEAIDGTGVDLVDCRTVPGIVPDMFPDGIHMTPEAAERYSRYLAGALPWSRLLEPATSRLSEESP